MIASFVSTKTTCAFRIASSTHVLQLELFVSLRHCARAYVASPYTMVSLANILGEVDTFRGSVTNKDLNDSWYLDLV